MLYSIILYHIINSYRLYYFSGRRSNLIGLSIQLICLFCQYLFLAGSIEGSGHSSSLFINSFIHIACPFILSQGEVIEGSGRSGDDDDIDQEESSGGKIPRKDFERNKNKNKNKVVYSS